jgi:hypothetical protein
MLLFLVTGVPRLGSALKALAVGVRVVGLALRAAFLANPIGLAIAGIAALGAIGVALYNSWEPFRNLIDWIWGGLKRLGSAIAGMPVIRDIIGLFSGSAPRLDAVPKGPALEPMAGVERAAASAPAALRGAPSLQVNLTQENHVVGGDADAVRGAMDKGARSMESAVRRALDDYLREQERLAFA